MQLQLYIMYTKQLTAIAFSYKISSQIDQLSSWKIQLLQPGNFFKSDLGGEAY